VLVYARLELLEEFVEGATGVVGIARARRTRIHRRRRRRRGLAGRAVAGHRDARRKQSAFVGFVLQWDAHRNRLEALEARPRFEMRALLAAVKLRIAFRAVAAEVGTWRDRRRTVVAPGCGHVLHKAGKPGAGDVEGRAGTLWFRTFAKGFAIAV
jgi:hypothetical protein